MEPVTLQTGRLELSLPVADDVDRIFDACQDEAIQLYTTVPSPYVRADAEDFVAKVAAWWADAVNPTWALRTDGRLVGTIGLYRGDGRGTAELGYWISPDARRRGYASEASRAVLDWGFSLDGLGLVRIEWRAVVGNLGSAGAARAVGFRYEGTMRRQLVNGRGDRFDSWAAAILASDDRTPQRWSVLEN